jgi:hypothetical protein
MGFLSRNSFIALALLLTLSHKTNTQAAKAKASRKSIPSAMTSLKKEPDYLNT